MDKVRYFDPRGPISFSANRLPHWQQAGAVYFVTFRLADSVPKHLLARWAAERASWLNLHPPPWTSEDERAYQDRFVSVIERWLDAGHGSCVLRRREFAVILADTLRHFDGERYELMSWVVMPNHVHAIFTLCAGQKLERVMHSWKLFSARRINGITGTTGSLWQRDYFDRLVRDRDHLVRCVRYVRRNPAKAKLRFDEYRLFESELARALD